MIQIELTYEEAEALLQVVENCLENIRDEIRHTDNRDYREMLKSQKLALQALLQHLEDGLKLPI